MPLLGSKGLAGDAGAGIRVLLAAASVTIYASAVLALRQDAYNPLLAEREAFATAVSTVVYHAPLGTAYSGVSASIRDANTPLGTALEQATKGNLDPGSLTQDGGMDGNGIGYLVLTAVAAFLFGVHTYSPILMMLGLMGISSTSFLLRFGAKNAAVVVFYFFALTLMLFTWQVYDAVTALNLPIGGIRYFAVLGIIPAFHLACELVDPTPAAVARRWRFGLLAVQVVILLLGALTRTSSASLLVATGLIWLLTLWRNHRDRFRIRRQIADGVFIGSVACAFLVIILLLLPPNYLAEGRITGQIWHRTFVGLGLNPEWPFGNLRDVYDCHYPGVTGLRLEPGALDMNGVCVWTHYANAHNIEPFPETFSATGWMTSVAGANAHTNQAFPVTPAAREAAEREAFFEVLRLYPRQVLDTYIYYKPRWLFNEIKSAMEPFLTFTLNGYSPFLKFLFFAAVFNLSLFLVIPYVGSYALRNLSLGGIGLLFAVSNLPGYLLAWPGTAQTFDLRAYAILIAGTVLNALAELIKRLCATGMACGWTPDNLYLTISRIIPAAWRNLRSDVREKSG
jgi:hypothetical protein